MNSVWIKYVRQTNSHDALWLNFYNDRGHMKFYKEVSKSFIFSQPRSFDVAQWWSNIWRFFLFLFFSFLIFLFFVCLLLLLLLLLFDTCSSFLCSSCSSSSLPVSSAQVSCLLSNSPDFFFFFFFYKDHAFCLLSALPDILMSSPPTRSHPGQLLGDGALV